MGKFPSILSSFAARFLVVHFSWGKSQLCPKLWEFWSSGVTIKAFWVFVCFLRRAYSQFC